MRLIGQHRLDTLALETTPDAVHLQGRPSREMLLRRVTRLGNEGIDADCLFIRLLIERHSSDVGAVFCGKRHNRIVEALDQNLALGTVHRVKEMHHGMDGIGNGPAIDTGMQIGPGSSHVNLHTGEALEGNQQPGLILAVLAPVGAEHEVAGQQIPLVRDQGRQLGAPDFLLPLQKELHVDGQGSLCLEQGFDGQDRSEHVALIVRCTTSVYPAIAHLWLKGWARPLVQWVSRLGIKMTINHHRRLPRRVQPLPVDNRVSTRRQDLHALQASTSEAVCDPLGCPLNITGMLRQCRNAGNAEEL